MEDLTFSNLLTFAFWQRSAFYLRKPLDVFSARIGLSEAK